MEVPTHNADYYFSEGSHHTRSTADFVGYIGSSHALSAMAVEEEVVRYPASTALQPSIAEHCS